MSIKIEEKPFGKLEDGSNVRLFRMTNKNGMSVELINYGATIRSIELKGSDGKTTDVCLGFDTIDGYLGTNPYFGCVAGRVANRIAKGRFTIDGKEYQLAQNNGENALHGGLKGFDKKIWNAFIEKEGVCFTYLSKDGEEGYPGNVIVNARYRLTNDNGLELAFLASATKPTPINLANHCYFNLAGHESGGENGLYDHEVCINANHYTPVSDSLIPTGEIASVASKPIFDLRIPKRLREMLPKCPGGENNGYDHNFCINDNFVQSQDGCDMRFVCIVNHPKSGRKLECYSNQPGVQFYTGNFIPTDGSVKGKNGIVYSKHGGFCLETQQYPDSVNQKTFPSDTILRPGKLYDHRVTYKFLDF